MQKRPIIRKHLNCDNSELRFSRVKLSRGHRYMVFHCKKCGYEEEIEVGILK